MITHEKATRAYIDILAILTQYPDEYMDMLIVKPHMIDDFEMKAYAEALIGSWKDKGMIDIDVLKDRNLENIYYSSMSKYFSIASPRDIFSTAQAIIFTAYRERSLRAWYEQFQRGNIDFDTMRRNIDEIESIASEVKPMTKDEYMAGLMKRIERLDMKHYNDFNDVLNLQLHDLLTISAETSAGKTALALNFLTELSKSYDCLYFNMEMPEAQILRRIAGIKSNIPVADIEDFEMLSEERRETVEKAADEITRDSHLYIINDPQTIDYISGVISGHDQSKPFVVVIDHMGFISDPQTNYGNNTLMLDAIMRRLRALSLRYNCTIINVCQLNRNASNEDVSLRRLKGSSEIEQSSSQVIMISRKMIVNKETGDRHEEITLKIEKNRNGRNGGRYKCNFDKQTQRFDIRIGDEE